MRSPSFHTVGSEDTVILEVDPPIRANERAYVITIRGRRTVVVQQLDIDRVAITNPTDEISFFMFCVGPRVTLDDLRSRFPILDTMLRAIS